MSAPLLDDSDALPCPFCGGPAHVNSEAGTVTPFRAWVSCACGAKGPSWMESGRRADNAGLDENGQTFTGGEGRSRAIALWNQRGQPPA